MNKYKKTYCNPLKIENFPRGYGEIPHRSISDPTVLWYEGKWYMYPSYNMAYISEDFVTWEHREISPCDLGWGPTVLEYNGKFYLYGRTGGLYVSDNPLGPFEKLGEIRFDNGNILGASIDPMIFADDDGKVYIYYAVDENLTTWWHPERNDGEKAITVNLAERYKISAMRIIWKEAGLDYENGNLPGPFKYVVDVSKDGKSWERVVDKSKNTKGFHIDYETFETVEANYARLTVLDSPEGIEPAVVSFTVFGILAF